MSEAGDKERKRKKQGKKLGKILSKAWELDEGTGAFQDGAEPSSTEDPKYLTDIGQKIDGSSYKLGRHGWEAFAQDIGAVYNRHIHGKSKHASLAKTHLKEIQDLLSAKDASLATIAGSYTPPETENASTKVSPKKRKKAPGEAEAGGSAKKPKKANTNSELAEREERAMEQISNFVEEHGGDRNQVAGYSCRVTRKSSGKFDVNFYNEVGRRFRSMREVGRFLNLVKDSVGGKQPVRRRGFPKKTTSREQEAQKKKLRKELERLRKAHQRATKSLDDFAADDEESHYPIDDALLRLDDEVSGSSSASSALVAGAAARVPDIKGFPNIPDDCIPEVLIAWDFLCTYHRTLNLSPIGLDDFTSALAYVPPKGQIGDDVVVAPVYLAEAHLSLLKLLLGDRTSDDWWWSTIETDGSGIQQQHTLDETSPEFSSSAPPIKINMESLISEVEEPLITASWIRILEALETNDSAGGQEIRHAVKSALKVVSSKWVAAYLKKVLDGMKSNGVPFALQSLAWIARQVKAAHPELEDASVKKEAINEAKSRVIAETTKQMENTVGSIPVVVEEDVVSDVEYDDDEDDESDDEYGQDAKDKSSIVRESKNEADLPASVFPPRPLPSLVDLLLPPSKPQHNADFVNAFTWAQLAGAAAARVVHRKKRILNEVDDSLRGSHALPPIVVSVRREREQQAASRFLMECGGDPARVERAIEHLSSGGNYVDLEVLDRISILRILIEAAYDSGRVFEVVNGNYKQRMSAMKALETEQRRAKREAKEKASADETAAREELAAGAKEKFLDEKREEIRLLNEKSKQYDADLIESLTDEDILDFDEDIKADFEALPTADSFSKNEVRKMVAVMQEQAAFDTDVLRVITMEQLYEREKRELEEMEGQLLGFGGEKALDDPSLDRETTRSIERLLRDIDKAKIAAERLPTLREIALAQLRDAIDDGTIKVLRSAVTAAKKAKLTGSDDETGGTWAVDLMRDAALELERAKQNKRVFDAQKDLIAKRNRCFIRNEPMGYDRFGNRFWNFDNDEKGHIWVETEFRVNSPSSVSPADGFVDLAREMETIAVGAADMEEDLTGSVTKLDFPDFDFKLFSRKEYHSSGFSAALAKQHWGCHAMEESLRGMIKLLDGRGIRESELKMNLKDALEEAIGSDLKHESAKEAASTGEEDSPDNLDGESELKVDGDKDAFRRAVELHPAEQGDTSWLEKVDSAIGQQVRIRQEITRSKDTPTARYENGRIIGWKIRAEEQTANEAEKDGGDESPVKTFLDIPVWKAQTCRGHTSWLNSEDLVASLLRRRDLDQGQGYFENDSVFLSYRNTMGRFCGKAADAPYASSPIFLARLMVKQEGDLYPKLKIRSYDNSWGGKSGARAMWTNSMKDYAYDFQTARQGLLTLENAFFELTGEFEDYESVEHEVDGKSLLDNPSTRKDIELETVEKVQGLWNSPASRAVFIEIVSRCNTTGILALALDLLCRNTMKYLHTHKLFDKRKPASSSYETTTTTSSRSSRRMNAWQQKQESDWY